MENNNEFIRFIIYEHAEEHEVVAHYTQIYKFNSGYFWNNKEIISHESYIKESIVKATACK